MTRSSFVVALALFTLLASPMHAQGVRLGRLVAEVGPALLQGANASSNGWYTRFNVERFRAAHRVGFSAAVLHSEFTRDKVALVGEPNQAFRASALTGFVLGASYELPLGTRVSLGLSGGPGIVRASDDRTRMTTTVGGFEAGGRILVRFSPSWAATVGMRAMGLPLDRRTGRTLIPVTVGVVRGL